MSTNEVPIKKKRGRKPKSLQSKNELLRVQQPNDTSLDLSIPSKRTRKPIYNTGDGEWADLGDVGVKQEKEEDDCVDDEDYEIKLEESEEEEENEEIISGDDNDVENDCFADNTRIKSMKKKYKPTNKDFWTQKDKLEVREKMKEYGRLRIMERWMDGRKLVKEIKNKSQYERHLPTNQGIRFRVKNARSSKKASPHITLDLFQSDTSAGSFSVNVGGPIWACHWCPQACHNNKHHHHQFFALYTHKNTREQFLIESSSSPPSSSSSDKRIIQLWDFGLLKPSNEDNAKPKSIGGCDGGEKDRSVVNLMLVEGGPVWDMKWSQGAWCCDEEEKEGEGLFERRRMGLLATASHDGVVRIYSVPGIKRRKITNKEQKDRNNNNINTAFEAEPAAKLVTNLPSACKCVAWNVSKDSVVVAAGYVDGTLALWSLTTTASLLLRENNNNNIKSETVQAYLVIKAHLNVLSDLTFNYDDLLVTVSLDRSIKFWNIRTTRKGKNNSSSPSNAHTAVFHMKGTRNTCVLWPPLEKFRVFVASDESFNYKRNSCLAHFFFDKRVSSTAQSTHHSTIWGIDYPFDNDVIVTCDNSGVVQACRLTSRKIKTNREMKSLVCVLKLDEDEDNGISTQTNNCGCNKRGIYCCCYRSFTYHDHLMRGFLRQEDMVCDDIVKNITCAIHKVSFNKNKGHTSWLFFGGLNGILRGVHLSIL